MRKYVIGLAVALVFLAYTFVIRNHHSRPIVPPTNLSKSTSTSSGSSTSNSNGSSTSNNTTSNTSTTSSSVTYKNGTYKSNVANAYYGPIQVSVDIAGGKIANVTFLQHPNDNPTSSYINQQADPYLKQEAIQAQSPNVSIISGATFSSEAFVQALSNALNQAKS